MDVQSQRDAVVFAYYLSSFVKGAKKNPKISAPCGYLGTLFRLVLRPKRAGRALELV